jgi:hypothetical protein
MPQFSKFIKNVYKCRMWENYRQIFFNKTSSRIRIIFVKISVESQCYNSSNPTLQGEKGQKSRALESLIFKKSPRLNILLTRRTIQFSRMGIYEQILYCSISTGREMHFLPVFSAAVPQIKLCRGTEGSNLRLFMSKQCQSVVLTATRLHLSTRLGHLSILNQKVKPSI